MNPTPRQETSVIDGARRCLESGRADHALHLLEIATDHRPELEAHPDSERFGEVVTLWKRFAGS